MKTTPSTGRLACRIVNANSTTQAKRRSLLTAGVACALFTTALGQTHDIVFYSNRAGNYDIWRMHEDGTGLMPLTTSPEMETSPIPSPDGKLIAYSRYTSGVYQTRVMNADGTNDRLIKEFPSGAGGYPLAWVPESDALVVNVGANPNQRYDRLTLDGTQTPFLTASVVGKGALAWSRFSPDGSKFAFAAQDGGWSPSMELYLANYENGAVVTTGIQRLTNNSQHDNWMAFSPDGTKLAFSRGVNTQGYEPPTNMYVMNADGTGTTQIDGTYYTAYCTDWSPKSEVLFQGQPTSADPGNLYTMNPDGTGVIKLTSGNYDDGGGRCLPLPTAIPNLAGTVHLLAGGTINGKPIDPTRAGVTVGPDDPLVLDVPVETNNLIPANAVAPLGATADWGARESAHWMVNPGIATGVHTYTVSGNLTAPTAPGIYHIVICFKGEFNTAQICSGSNWTAPVNWNDGNDVGFDWGSMQFEAARRDGAVLVTTQYQAPLNYQLAYLPAAVIIVRVVAPCSRLTNDTGTVKLLPGGTINGTPVGPDQSVIRVAPGARLQGQIKAEANNRMGSNVVAPMGAIAEWGARDTAHWTVNPWIPTGVGIHDIPVDRIAPDLPGTYHIVVAFAGEMNFTQVAAQTNWSALPGQVVTWNDGNDAAFDWGISEFAAARTRGAVLTRYQTSPTSYGPRYLPATVVTVQVVPPNWGDLDTDMDGESNLYDTDDDNDGVADTDEATNGTDPLMADTDEDGLGDAEEATAGSDPLKVDTDGDSLADGFEVGVLGTLPSDPDSDGDGLTDSDEAWCHTTNPLLADTDEDGFDDKFEIETGYDPLSETSTPFEHSDMVTAVEFRFNGAMGRTYRIESSTDLQTWETVESGIAGTGGRISRLYSVQGMPKRYFRAERE